MVPLLLLIDMEMKITPITSNSQVLQSNTLNQTLILQLILLENFHFQAGSIGMEMIFGTPQLVMEKTKQLVMLDFWE